MDLKLIATYPFLSDAKNLIKNFELSLEELLKDFSFEKARSFSLDRLENAFVKKDVGERRLVTESDYLAEVLSYQIAKMIVACLDDNFLLRRYALAEAFHAYNHLKREGIDFIVYVAKDLGLNVKFDENTSIHFVDYLRFAPTRYKEWKMVNRPLKNGYIILPEKDLIRIIKERLMVKIAEEIEGKACIDLVKEVFGREIARFKQFSATEKKRIRNQPVGKVRIEKLPPCIKSILASIQAGENVPHMGRFALVAFLSALGVSNEEILKIFTSAPDFDDEKARYQVEHITGKRSSTKYAPPGCKKMKTYGFCSLEMIDDTCRKVKNPVSYYWLKVKEGGE